jgi:hypothetical protein
MFYLDSMIGCKKDQDGFNRTCGKVSTYNNGACRGPACTEAVRLIRAAQRSAARADKPKKK